MKAIAMKCTQEQFDAVMPKLKKEGFSINSVTSFDTYPYLFGNIVHSTISNVDKSILNYSYCKKIHETWNEKIFLEACGIEVMKPTLEEVKEYFENAEKVVSLKVSEFVLSESVLNNAYIYGEDETVTVYDPKDDWHRVIYNFNTNEFAKILTTKEKAFSITAEQLIELSKNAHPSVVGQLKQWFPEVFDVKLEVGKWMKTPNGGFYCPKEKLKNGFGCYGFSPEKTWLERKVSKKEAKNDVEATEEEIFEVLENKAVKQGFVEGARITPMFSNGNDYFPDNNTINKPLSFIFEDNILKVRGGLDCYRIFVNGVWAKIIPTCTRKEAEKLLNKKIID